MIDGVFVSHERAYEGSIGMELIIPSPALAPANTAVPVRSAWPLTIAILSAFAAIISCLAALRSLPLHSLPSGSPSLQFVHIDEDLCGRNTCGLAAPRPPPPKKDIHREPASSFLFTPIVIPIDRDADTDWLFPPRYWGGYGFEMGGVH